MTDQLSMSMFATRADYDAAARAQAEDEPRAPVVTGSPDTIWLCYGDLDRDATHRECAEVMWCEDKQEPSDVRYVRADLLDAEHTQHVTLQHHACDLEQRIAEPEAAR